MVTSSHQQVLCSAIKNEHIIAVSNTIEMKYVKYPVEGVPAKRGIHFDWEPLHSAKFDNVGKFY